jgi:hypothetical protein
MRRPREEIYQALFTLVCGMNTAQTPFNLMSRRWQSWATVPANSLPALFQQELIEEADQHKLGGVTRWRLKPIIWIYLPVDETLNAVQSTIMNNYKDALDLIMQAGPAPTYPGAWPGGAVQSLGGLVMNAFIEGPSVMDEGLVSPPAILKTNITIIVPQ